MTQCDWPSASPAAAPDRFSSNYHSLLTTASILPCLCRQLKYLLCAGVSQTWVTLSSSPWGHLSMFGYSFDSLSLPPSPSTILSPSPSSPAFLRTNIDGPHFLFCQGKTLKTAYTELHKSTLIP